MTAICIFFEFHHSIPIAGYNFFDIGKHHEYFQEEVSKEKLLKKLDESFLPAINMLNGLVKTHKGKFRAALSLSGVLIEQLEKWRPDVLTSLQKLVKRGHFTFLAEPFYHSLSFLYDRAEFSRQIALHQAKIEEYFGQSPRVFKNSELIYNNFLAYFLDQFDYKGIITEGVWNILKGRPLNQLYAAIDGANPRLLLRNYQLSEDLVFRFHDPDWEQFPLFADTWLSWLKGQEGELITLGLSADGLFPALDSSEKMTTFWNQWVENAINENMSFLTPEEAISSFEPIDKLTCDEYISAEIHHRDNSAWQGTEMQKEYLENLYGLKDRVFASRDTKLIERWSLLQQTDLIFNPDAEGVSHNLSEIYIKLMNMLADLRMKLATKAPENTDSV